MSHTFTGRDGKLRIYSGDSPPYYLEVKFEQLDLESVFGRPRPQDPVAVHVGGYSHSPGGADYDSGLYEPVPLTFSCWLNNADVGKLRAALCNPDLLNPWQVGGNNTWTSSKGRGSIVLMDGSFIATQPFFDTQKVAVNIEAQWTSPLSGSVLAMQWSEFYAAPQEISFHETPDVVELRVQGLVYGNIKAIPGFTTGNAV